MRHCSQESRRLWNWEHFAMTKVAWDFLIHDFPPSFVKDQLQPIQTKYLKKWSGLARAADPSVLYRSRENAGLGLKESCEEHKRQRLIRRHQLATSKDPRVRAIHEEFAKSQRQRDKVNFHQLKRCPHSKQLATYDPKKKNKRHKEDTPIRIQW